MKRLLLPLMIVCLLVSSGVTAQESLYKNVEKGISELEPKVIAWRRDIHEHPELSNREFKTAEKVAEHLRSLGLEVETGIAHTGVIGILKGGKPGPTVALRADMDGLPVVEQADVPFASREISEYEGREVGVMHACGHDTHVAILMGVAELLSGMQKDIKGTVKFIFQPAEEGAPQGEEGGADLMVKEGVMEGVDAVFGLHINSKTEAGKIAYKPGGTMASATRYMIKVKGQQVHGAYPWDGTDPIVTAAQIINGLQTIVSRKMELVNEAAVVSVGSIHGGVRNNIIPNEVVMDGTFRALDEEMRVEIGEQIRLKAVKIAESMGAEAEVTIFDATPVTYNDPSLTNNMLPALEAAAGDGNVLLRKAVTGAEDFSFFAQEAPGFYFFLGGMPAGTDPADAPAHHTPEFYVSEDGLMVGVKALAFCALKYLGEK